MTFSACLAARLILCASTITSVASAQSRSPIAKGSAIIAGNAAFSRRHDEITDETATSLHVQPTVLYFVRSRLAVGATLALGYSRVSSGHGTQYGFGPSVRYHFGDLGGKLFPFLSASFFPEWTHSDIQVQFPSGSSDFDFRRLTFDGSFGLTQMVASHVGITGEAYYSHHKLKSESPSATTNATAYDYGLRFGVTAFIH